MSRDNEPDEPESKSQPGRSSSLSQEGDPLLRCEDVKTVLGNNQILRGVEFTVTAGTVLGVLGPSGAGKSTLFRTLVGELSPSHGRVLLQGRDITRLPLWVRARLGLGYVPQTPSVLFDLSVENNLRTFAKLAGASWADVMHRVQELSLGERLEVRARELSGGERRRLELLRALLAQPKVLVCDEPLTGLDPHSVAKVGGILRNLVRSGSAVIFADHRISEVLPFCDEALLLVDGRVLTTSSADRFVGHPAVQERYLT